MCFIFSSSGSSKKRLDTACRISRDFHLSWRSPQSWMIYGTFKNKMDDSLGYPHGKPKNIFFHGKNVNGWKWWLESCFSIVIELWSVMVTGEFCLTVANHRFNTWYRIAGNPNFGEPPNSSTLPYSWNQYAGMVMVATMSYSCNLDTYPCWSKFTTFLALINSSPYFSWCKQWLWNPYCWWLTSCFCYIIKLSFLPAFIYLCW